MGSFPDKGIDGQSYAGLAEALAAEFLKRDKRWLAKRLALETVDRLIEQRLREEFETKRSELETGARDLLGRTLDGALKEIDRRQEDWLVGIGHRRTQRARRMDKPAADPYDQARNERIRSFHARLKAAGAADATSRTAAEFELSDRQIRKIVSRSS